MSNKVLNYIITIEDLATFVEHHQRNSKNFQSDLQRQRYFVLGLFLLFGLLLGIILIQSISDTPEDFVVGSLAFLFFAILGLYIFAHLPHSMGKTIRSSAEKTYSGGKNLTLLGKHELTIDDAGLTTRNDYYESTYSWAAFEKLLSNSEYIFLYCSAVTAIIIPKNKVIEEDWQAIESILREKVLATT